METTSNEVEVEVTGAVGEVKKEKQLIPNITRGRMPIAVVAQVRFGKNSADSVKSLADMYGTTVGKIDDIKKNRNFAYVTEDFRPTAQMKADGLEWLQRHHKFEDGAVDALIVELESTPEATTEDAAAFAEVKKSARAQEPKTKTGEVADAGGGNRTKGNKKAKAPKEETVVEANADDLLA
jgi:hypothetical protein